MSSPSVLYTIGYEGRTLGALVRALREAGVERVVDVRLTPHSRQKGFSVMALFEGLRKAGLSYEHIRELGNPPEIRTLFHSGDVEQGRAMYRRFLKNGAGASVDYLIGLAALQPIAILCREHDAESCHRHVIAEVAQRRTETLKVVHL